MIKICTMLISPEILKTKEIEMEALGVIYEQIDKRTFIVYGDDEDVRADLVKMFPYKDRIIY